MDEGFTLSQFHKLFSDDDACLDVIKMLKYPNGIYCPICKRITKHYKLDKRTAYTCKICRNQIYPLSGTIFEKTTTPLTVWFYAMFLMTHTRADLSVKQLQRELGVTYKTAWRMYQSIQTLMRQNKGDLLFRGVEIKQQTKPEVADQNKTHKWTFFKRLEIKVVLKQETSDSTD